MRSAFQIITLILVSVCLLSACFQRTAGKPSTSASGGLIGGAGATAQKSEEDEMLIRQQKEIERQRRELEDVKRQKYYDEQYRDYLKDHP